MCQFKLLYLQEQALLVFEIEDQVEADGVLLVVADEDLLVVHLPLEDMNPVVLVEAITNKKEFIMQTEVVTETLMFEYD